VGQKRTRAALAGAAAARGCATRAGRQRVAHWPASRTWRGFLAVQHAAMLRSTLPPRLRDWLSAGGTPQGCAYGWPSCLGSPAKAGLTGAEIEPGEGEVIGQDGAVSLMGSAGWAGASWTATSETGRC